MKLISFKHHGQAGFGAVVDQGVVSLKDRLEKVTNLADLAAQPVQLEQARKIIKETRPDIALSEITFEPVIPNPHKIICVGINYVAHAQEAGRTVGKYPVIFQRFADTLAAHEEPLLKPKVSDDFDYEGEIAVVIGKGGDHIAPDDAMSHVFGYTLFNDATPRDWQFHTHQYGMGKNFRKSGSLGPWIVTKDEIPDAQAISLKTLLNGVEVQSGHLGELAFDIPTLISYVSKALTWKPGDILATGTPSGVGFKRNPPLFMKEGDVVEVVSPQIGVLHNTVTDER